MNYLDNLRLKEGDKLLSNGDTLIVEELDKKNDEIVLYSKTHMDRGAFPAKHMQRALVDGILHDPKGRSGELVKHF